MFRERFRVLEWSVGSRFSFEKGLLVSDSTPATIICITTACIGRRFLVGVWGAGVFVPTQLKQLPCLAQVATRAWNGGTGKAGCLDDDDICCSMASGAGAGPVICFTVVALLAVSFGQSAALQGQGRAGAQAELTYDYVYCNALYRPRAGPTLVRVVASGVPPQDLSVVSRREDHPKSTGSFRKLSTFVTRTRA